MSRVHLYEYYLNNLAKNLVVQELQSEHSLLKLFDKVPKPAFGPTCRESLLHMNFICYILLSLTLIENHISAMCVCAFHENQIVF